MKLVTIAIASYNNGKYIERCVDSVRHQTYQNLEILIVDDSSNDDTLSRLEKYGFDCRVKILSKENGGLSSVRQMSLEMATGDYICFIDADDYLMPEYVERMLTKLLNDNTDICICSTSFENENGNKLQRSKYLCTESVSPIIPTIQLQSNSRKQITSGLYLSDSWNKLFRIAFLKETGVHFCMPKGYNGTDSIFNRLLVLHEPSYSTISYEGYVHVLYEKSAVHRKRKDLLFSYMRIVEGMMDECIKIGISEKMKETISVYYIRCIVSSCIDVYKDDNCYLHCLRAVNQIYRKHSVFVSANGLSKLPVVMVPNKYIRILAYMFFKCRVLMPLGLSLYSKLIKLKS
jgi:glycosyltransferase involved in cell wall biosynthesis